MPQRTEYYRNYLIETVYELNPENNRGAWSTYVDSDRIDAHESLTPGEAHLIGRDFVDARIAEIKVIELNA